MTGSAPTAPSPPGWTTAGFRALGTGVTVSATCREELTAAVAVVRDQLAAVDEACSRFRPDSELVSLGDAGGRPVRVGPVLLAAVDVALRAARLTDGLVDPTLGAELCRLGYDRDFALVADGTGAGGAAPVRVRRRYGWRDIELDRVRHTVMVPSGLSLDLGATAKALAVDRCVAAAVPVLSGGVLVGVGGDLAAGGRAPAGG